MCRRVSRIACFVLTLAIAGCSGMFARQGMPPDPLFANRKPIEAKAPLGPPAASPVSELAPAANPYFAGAAFTSP